jgi:hypothetical protein
MGWQTSGEVSWEEPALAGRWQCWARYYVQRLDRRAALDKPIIPANLLVGILPKLFRA